MSDPPDIRATMMAEYTRLHRLWAEQQVAIKNAGALKVLLVKRMNALGSALTAYGSREDGDHTVESLIAEQYTLGRPTDTIASELSDRDHETRTWSEEDVDRRAAELGIKRPDGWNAARAKKEWNEIDWETNDEWLECPYGLPDAAELLDRQACDPPRLLLPAPEPTIPALEIPVSEPAPRNDRLPSEPVVRPLHVETERPRNSYQAMRAVRSDHDPRISAFLANRWTTDRIALVEQEWPTYKTVDDIRDALNRLPGEEIISNNQVSSLANTTLKLSRPPDFMNEMRRRKGSESAGWATAERKELLRLHWPAEGVSLRLRKMMTAQPGPQLPTSGVINSYCYGVLMLVRSKPSIPMATRRAEKDAAFVRRQQIMREMWPTNATDEEVLAALNAVEGFGSRLILGDLSAWARMVGVSRPATTAKGTEAAYAPVGGIAEGKNPSLLIETDIPVENQQVVSAAANLPAEKGKNPEEVFTLPLADAARALGHPVPPPRETVLNFSSIRPTEKPKLAPPPPPRPNLGPPRLAKALKLPPVIAVSHDPIEADFATIRATSDLWGVPFRGAVDLWAVNKAAEKRGARQFKLVETVEKPTRKSCMNCGKPFKSDGPHNRLCVPCGGSTNIAEHDRSRGAIR